MKLTEKKLLRALGEADQKTVDQAAPRFTAGEIRALESFTDRQKAAPVPRKDGIIRRITEIGALCAAVALFVLAGFGLFRLKRKSNIVKNEPGLKNAEAVLAKFLDAANAGDSETILKITKIGDYCSDHYAIPEGNELPSWLVYPSFLPDAPEDEQLPEDYRLDDEELKERKEAAKQKILAALKYDSWKITGRRESSDELAERKKRVADRRDLEIFRSRESGDKVQETIEIAKTEDALWLLGWHEWVYTFEVTYQKDGERKTDSIDVYFDPAFGELDETDESENWYLPWNVQPFDLDAAPLTAEEQQELDSYREKQAASGSSPLQYQLHSDYAEIISCDVTAQEVTIPAEYQGVPVTYCSFSNCFSLEQIAFEDNHGQFNGEDFYDTPWLDKLKKQNPMVVFGDVLMSAGNVSNTNVEIPDGVRYIGGNVFRGSSIRSVVIPDGVVIIGESAFAYCYNLNHVTIPDSVKSIGKFAFRWCEELDDITIPVGVKSIGGRAFDGTPMEKSALRQQSMHIVNSILLRAEGSGSFAVPETVTAIAGEAFRYTDFTELIVPDSVTELDEKAFYDMEFLSKITLPSGIRKLPARAFELCLALEEYTVPDSVTAIGDGAFSNCRNLKDIYIPESVTFIGKDVFEKDIEDSVQLTIHGKAGSAAEEAAKREGIPFIAE